ncbi:MAG: hypothetical protein HQK54_06720 [Oligoflexales bacterium]|nr:hypothetical protein [Oligoflexales bacterium]
MKRRHYYNILIMLIMPAVMVIVSLVGYQYPGNIDKALYVKDETMKLSIDDVMYLKNDQFLIYSHNSTRFISLAEAVSGKNVRNIWLKISAENSGSMKREMYFQIGQAVINKIDFFKTNEGRILSSEHLENSRNFPFSKRRVKSFDPTFSFMLEPYESADIYVKMEIKGITAQTPFRMFDKESFEKWEQIGTYSKGTLLGILFTMVIFSLLTLLSIKESGYFYYFMVSGAIFSFDFIYTGPGIVSLSASYADSIAYILIFITFIGILAWANFVIEFLFLKDSHPKLYTFIKKISLAVSLLILLTFALPESVKIYFSAFLIAFFIIVMSVPFSNLLKNVRSPSFVMVWPGFFICEIITISSYFSYFPSNMVSDNIHYFGHVWLLLLIPKALIDRIRILIDEKRILTMKIMQDVPKKSPLEITENNEEPSYHSTEHVVTIMFVDIMNFSQVSERAGALKILPVLAGFISQINDIIYQYDGTIDRSLGDGVLAIFGYRNNENTDNIHAVNAFNAAMQIQKIWMKALSAEQDRQLLVMPTKIGIHTDKVLVGNLGGKRRIDYTIISNGVNYARRLESSCAPFKIILSESTLEKIPSDSYDFRAMNKIKIAVKHESSLVDAYEYNPYFGAHKTLMELEKNYWISAGASPAKERIALDREGLVTIKTAELSFDVSDFSEDGYSALGNVLLARNVSIKAQMLTHNPTFNKIMKNLMIDEFELEVRWSRVSNGKYRHGFKIRGVSERRKKFIFEILRKICDDKDIGSALGS